MNKENSFSNVSTRIIRTYGALLIALVIVLNGVLSGTPGTQAENTDSDEIQYTGDKGASNELKSDRSQLLLIMVILVIILLIGIIILQFLGNDTSEDEEGEEEELEDENEEDEDSEEDIEEDEENPNEDEREEEE